LRVQGRALQNRDKCTVLAHMEQMSSSFGTRTLPALCLAYRYDLMATAGLFVAMLVVTGRVVRAPFDDEIYTLDIIGSGRSFSEILFLFLNGIDVHPPLSYLFFLVLQDLGLDAGAMRGVAAATTALALVAIHGLTLHVLAGRRDGAIPPATRLTTILIFGLSAMAVSQGDALRWYPLFALLVALFLLLYLTAERSGQALVSAIPLGLAASTDLLAALVVLPFAAYRYGLECRFRLGFEVRFWSLFTPCALPGLITAASLAGTGFHTITRNRFPSGTVSALLNDLLGFFGGHALGVSQGWVVVPLGLIFMTALIRTGATAAILPPGVCRPMTFFNVRCHASSDARLSSPPALIDIWSRVGPRRLSSSHKSV